jgi:hypothetical protein
MEYFSKWLVDMGAKRSGTHERSATEGPLNESQPIEPWEDGYRTNKAEETFKWWYFDSTCEDGTTIVVCFTTKAKNPTKPPVTPNVTTIIKDAAGEKRTFDCTGYDVFSSSCPLRRS